VHSDGIPGAGSACRDAYLPEIEWFTRSDAASFVIGVFDFGRVSADVCNDVSRD
jgi:hypothetical protein